MSSSSLSRAGAAILLAVASLTIMVGCAIVPGLPRIARALDMEAHAGWLVTLPSLGVVLFGPVAGWLIDRVGSREALAGGLVAYAALGLGALVAPGPVAIYADRLLLGGATAVIMAGGTHLLRAAVLPRHRSPRRPRRLPRSTFTPRLAWRRRPKHASLRSRSRPARSACWRTGRSRSANCRIR